MGSVHRDHRDMRPNQRRRARLLPTAVGLFGLVLAGLGATTVRGVAAAPTPGFGTPVASGIQANGFEQDLRLDPANGYIYTSAPQSLSSTISAVWRSNDAGQTFKFIPASVQPAGKPLTCVGGGDSELAVDSSGSLFFNDLTLGNFSTARSDDHGTSFGPNVSCAGVPDAGVDRQWYAVDGSVTQGGFLNLAYDRVAQSPPAPPKQTPVVCPGGASAGPAQNVLVLAQSPILPGVQAGVNFGPSQPLSCDEGIMGNDEFFHYGDGKRVFVVHDNAAFNSVSMARCDEVGIAVATPTGYANCQDKVISSFPGSKTGGNFPTMTIDRQGHLFAVWEQAPISGTTITGDTHLYYSTSTDEGNTWAAAQVVPTPGLNNDVFAWPGAGDNGAVDVAFVATPATFQGTAGPDSTVGDWSVWMVQFLPGQGWSAPILASEHHIHHGTIQTVLGGQTGDRTLGDFIQLRVGSQGEANISYSDSNNIDEATTPEAMFVRQNSGSSVFSSPATVSGTAALTGNCSSDPAGDATLDSNGTVGTNQPNLDLLNACMSAPDAAHYQVTMKVADLTSLAPSPGAGGATLIWQMQWHVPSSTDPHGGALFMVYMESVGGQPPTCWAGQNATTTVGGGVALTYPGSTALTGTACSYTPTAPGTITITVPTSAVTEPGAIDSTLYTVTASTQSLPAGNAETPPSFGGIGGQLFNLLDVAPAFDFNPTAGAVVPEAPLTSVLLVMAGTGGAATIGRRRRRRGSPTTEG